MTTQLQQCREVAAALEEECMRHREREADWREHRAAANKALYDMPTVLENYRSALARAEAAERRVAELEAAAAWRPGDEEPPAPGWYQTAEGDDVVDFWSHAFFDGVIWFDYPGNNRPMFWRPILPPPPDAAEAAEARP